jgi:HK97 gp10 family phage protein
MVEIKTLRTIARDTRTLLESYTPVNKNPNAPTRGNLKKQMLNYNSVNKIVGKSKQTKRGNLTTQLNQTLSVKYAPPGAEYGKFVNDGTRYIEPRKFANRALNEAVKKNIKLIVKDLAKIVGDELRSEIGKI